MILEYIGEPLKGKEVVSKYMLTFKNPKENLKKTIVLQDHGNPVPWWTIIAFPMIFLLSSPQSKHHKSCVFFKSFYDKKNPQDFALWKKAW